MATGEPVYNPPLSSIAGSGAGTLAQAYAAGDDATDAQITLTAGLGPLILTSVNATGNSSLVLKFGNQGARAMRFGATSGSRVNAHTFNISTTDAVTYTSDDNGTCTWEQYYDLSSGLATTVWNLVVGTAATNPTRSVVMQATGGKLVTINGASGTATFATLHVKGTGTTAGTYEAIAGFNKADTSMTGVIIHSKSGSARIASDWRSSGANTDLVLGSVQAGGTINEAITIEGAAGLVGINCTPSASRLHVTDAGTANNVGTFESTTNSTTASTNVEVRASGTRSLLLAAYPSNSTVSLFGITVAAWVLVRANSNSAGMIIGNTGAVDIVFGTNNVERMRVDHANLALKLSEAFNVAAGTTTGTKIGTANTQKLGFWNATPVVQQVLATGGGATVDNVITFLQTIGLCKQS
jgi:hypothetical protein